MFGGSGGIVVVSSCLDGPRVHRPADIAWMEARVDSRQVTGAGTTKLAARDLPGVARPGRITVRAALARTLERKSSTRRAVRLLQSKDRRGRPNRTRTTEVDSQAILLQGRGPSEGGLPGCPRGVPVISKLISARAYIYTRFPLVSHPSFLSGEAINSNTTQPSYSADCEKNATNARAYTRYSCTPASYRHKKL